MVLQKSLAPFISAALIISGFYFVSSFVYLTTDPSQWQPEIRLLVACAAFIALAFAFGSSISRSPIPSRGELLIWRTNNDGIAPVASIVHIIRKDGQAEWNLNPNDARWTLEDTNPIDRYMIKIP